MPRFGYPRINLAAGQLSAFSRLGSLRHLDLNLFGADQIFAGNAEPSGGHLFNCGAFIQTVRSYGQTLRAFASLSAVRLAAQTVHGNGKRLMRFPGNGAVGHCAGLEPFYNRINRFHLFNRNSLFRKPKVQQPS